MNARERIDHVLKRIAEGCVLEEVIAVNICAARREAMGECIKILAEFGVPSDSQIEGWGQRERTKENVSKLDRDEVICFCCADLCADKIRALIKQGEG